MDIAEVRRRLAAVPRVELVDKPTPLHHARHLSKELGVELHIKRDDLTGIAFGGNKSRNLEFRLQPVADGSFDTVIVTLDKLSNSARQTVGACNRLGVRTVLVLKGEPDAALQGNLLLDYLLGAEVVFAPDRSSQAELAERIRDRLIQEGKRPYFLNEHPMFETASALAYLEASMEVSSQLASSWPEAEFDYVYMTSGAKGQAGLELAKRLLGKAWSIHGVTVTHDYDVAPRAARIAEEAAKLLGVDLRIDPSTVTSFDDYVGPGYGIPTQAGLEAIALMARTEGIMLDPVYTGKGFSGLVDHVRTGLVPRGSRVLFVHTGGTPALFSFSGELQRALGLLDPLAVDR